MNNQKPTKEILIDYAANLSRNEFADFLEQIASKIREQGSFTFIQNEEEITVKLPDYIKTEIEYEIENGKHEFEIEIEWREGQAKQSKMTIK